MHTLVLQGITLVEAAGVTPVAFDESAERVEYWARPVELDRLARILSIHVSSFTERYFERLQGEVIRLALPGAESRESFAREVLADELPRAKELE